MSRKKRRHYAIEKLSPDIKEVVDEMIKADFTYKEIVDYIQSTGNSISKSAVQRYAANLTETLQTLRMTQENFRAMMEEISRYPDIDYSESILRLSSGLILEAIMELPDEEKKPADMDTLIKTAISLTRAFAYKKNIDIKNKAILENGLEQFQCMIYEVLCDEQPKLYKELKKFIEKKSAD